MHADIRRLEEENEALLQNMNDLEHDLLNNHTMQDNARATLTAGIERIRRMSTVQRVSNGYAQRIN